MSDLDAGLKASSTTELTIQRFLAPIFA
jgi:hypothetical protein